MTQAHKRSTKVEYTATDRPLEMMRKGLAAGHYKQDILEDLEKLARTARPDDKKGFEDGIAFLKDQIRLCEVPL